MKVVSIIQYLQGICNIKNEKPYLLKQCRLFIFFAFLYSITGACVAPSPSKACGASPSRSLCKLDRFPRASPWESIGTTFISMNFSGISPRKGDGIGGTFLNGLLPKQLSIPLSVKTGRTFRESRLRAFLGYPADKLKWACDQVVFRPICCSFHSQ